MAVKVSGSVCAAQPVTINRAFGFSRRSLRISCRALRTASEVTAQVLTTTASSTPGLAGQLFHRFGFIGVQPAAQRGKDRGAGHHLAPRKACGQARRRRHAPSGRSSRRRRRASRYVSVPPSRSPANLPAGQPLARRGHGRRAGGRSRGQGDPNAALPHPHADMIRALRCWPPGHWCVAGKARAFRSAVQTVPAGSPQHLRRRTCNAGCPCPWPLDALRWASSSVSISSDRGMSDQSS